MKKLPNVNKNLKSWEQNIVLILITKEIIDGWLQETQTVLNYTAVVQPMNWKEQLMLKEGQRSYKNQWLHSSQNILVNNDALVKFNSIIYRVLKTKDYKLYGYTELFLLEDNNFEVQ